MNNFLFACLLYFCCLDRNFIRIFECFVIRRQAGSEIHCKLSTNANVKSYLFRQKMHLFRCGFFRMSQAQKSSKRPRFLEQSFSCNRRFSFRGGHRAPSLAREPLMGDSTMFLTPPNSKKGGLLPHFFVLKINVPRAMLFLPGRL